MGAIVNPVTIERGLRAEFSKALQVVPDAILDSLMMPISSTVRDEKYGWLGAVPQMQRFLDEKQPKGALNNSYTISNVPYEATIKVDKFDLKDDQVGAAFLRTRDLTVRGKLFPQKLLMDTVVANGPAYDGTAFFATTHSQGSSGTQSNLLTGTGTTAVAIQTDFYAAWAALIGFKDDAGEPMVSASSMVRPVVVCPVALFGVFQVLQQAAVINNQTNTIKGLFDLSASPRLTDVNDWYLFDVGTELKPYVKQEIDPLTFGALEQSSDSGFKTRFYLYGIEWRGAVGNAFWQKGVKTTN